MLFLKSLNFADADQPLKPVKAILIVEKNSDRKTGKTTLYFDYPRSRILANEEYMDDVLILTPTQWKLREAIKVLNQTFSELRLEKYPDKTFIGGIKKRFDFLGYRFSPEGPSVALRTIENLLSRAVRLYEQEQEEPFGSPQLGLYARRWLRWVSCIACGNVDLFFKFPHESCKTD